MVERDNNHSGRKERMRFKDVSVDFTDGPQFFFQSEFLHNVGHGKSSQGGDNARLDGFNLPVQKRRVKFYFFGERIAIIWRTVFEDVSDVHVIALEIDGGAEFVQNFSRRAAKWVSGLRFVASGGFADKHQVRGVTPLADDGKIIIFRAVYIEGGGSEVDDIVANGTEYFFAIVMWGIGFHIAEYTTPKIENRKCLLTARLSPVCRLSAGRQSR